MKEVTKASFIKGLRIIFANLLLHKKALITLSCLALFSSLINGVTPYVWGRLIDTIISTSTVSFLGRSWPLFALFLGLWALIQVVSTVVSWLSNTRRESLGLRINFDWQLRNFKKLLELPLDFFKKNPVGKLENRISRASGKMETIFSQILANIIPQFVTLIMAIGISFYINARLAFIMVAGMLVFILVAVRQAKKIGKQLEQAEKFDSRAYGSLWDVVGNINEVKSASTERHETAKATANFSEKLYSLWFNVFKIWIKLDFLQRVIILSTQVVMFTLAISLIRAGELTLGELVMFSGYSALILGPFAVLADYWHSFQSGLIAINETEKILERPSENYEPEQLEEIKKLKGHIVFKNVDFFYTKTRPILKDISFEALPGETIALVGESGVGKSTLTSLLSGFYFPKAGKITIDGHDIRKVDLRFLRSQIAVVPQQVVLFNDTIKNNIRYSNFSASFSKVVQAAEQARALDFIQKFPKKWQTPVGERGVKLSVGQKQRVSIARAILRDPKILILDEPTSALDAKTEKVLSTALEKLMKGRTTFIIAHRLSTVRRADKILVVKDGQIAEIGNHEELMLKEKGLYKEMYDLQIGLKA